MVPLVTVTFDCRISILGDFFFQSEVTVEYKATNTLPKFVRQLALNSLAEMLECQTGEKVNGCEPGFYFLQIKGSRLQMASF